MQRDIYPTRRHAKSDFVPRQDPVVRRRRALPEGVSQAQIDRFERDGLVVIEDLFDAETIRAANAEVERLRAAAEQLEADTVVREPESDAIRSIFRLHRQSPKLAQLAEHPTIQALVRAILDDDAYIMQSRINDKAGFDGACFDWHSDFETWHAEDGMPRMRALSLSIFLTDNSDLNGPTMFIPGSHRTFVSCPGETPDENYRTSLRRQRIGVPPASAIARLAEQGGIVAPSGRAGTVVLFDCNTLHASASNMTPWPRSNLFFVFNAYSNALQKPFEAEKPRPSFLAEQAPAAA